jgi:tetratricopeptide (TPR) repeat protein
MAGEVMKLSALADERAAELAAAVESSAALSRRLLDTIVARADGVPLFIEELTKTIVERRPSRHDETSVLPETLQASLMARLDRLAAAKEVAQIGSVIGREFREDLVAAIAPMPAKTLREGLDQLVSAGLAFRHGHGTNVSYAFKHALVQDAAYETLLRAQRASLHGLIARELARSADIMEASPEMPARHYACAGITKNAVLCWLRAAQLAMSRWANLEAIAHLKAALDAVEADDRHGVTDTILLDVWMRLADCLLEVRGYGTPETAAAYRRAMQIAKATGAETTLFAALVGLSNYYLHKGEVEDGIKISEELVHRAARAGDVAAEASGHRMIGVAFLQGGDLLDAKGRFETALTKHDQALADNHRYNHRVSCRYYLSQTLLPMGLEVQARELCREAMDIARSSQFPSHIALALDGFCSLHQHCREWDDLGGQGEALVQLASDKKLPFWLSFGEVAVGLALAKQGSADAGIRRIESGLELYRNTGAERSRPALLGALAAAYEVAGEVERAGVVLDQAIHLAHSLSHRVEGALRRNRGEVFARQGPDCFVLAEDQFTTALAIARAQSAKTFELRACLCLCALYGLQGRHNPEQVLKSALPSMPRGLLALEVDRMQENSTFLQSSPVKLRALVTADLASVTL